jgi:hypothetical protein
VSATYRQLRFGRGQDLAGKGQRSVVRAILWRHVTRRAIERPLLLEHRDDGADRFLELRAVPLAGRGADDVAAWVDEDLGGPGADGVALPDGEVRVVGHRVANVEALQRAADVGRLPLVVELGGVHADHDERVTKGGLQPLQVGQHVQAVDAPVRPEVEQHDLAPQPGQRQRHRRVQPRHRAIEFGSSYRSLFGDHVRR